MATKKSKKPSPLDILNRVRDKARLDEKPYQQIQVVKMKAGKIKFQLLALNDDFLFAQRRQHVIPTIPHDDDPNSKWMVVNCEGENCPICRAAESFKKSGVELEDVNAEYKPKYPFKSLRSVFTQPDHYLLCARILVDQCEDGNYLPKDAEIGSTQLIQFSKTALNNLMAAYEDFIDDFADSQEEDAEAPALFAIFDGDDTADSLTISCRITNQPFSATFSFSKVTTASLDEVNKSKLEILEKGFEPNNEDYVAKCIKRIKNIQNYFVNGGGSISEDDSADSFDDDDDDDLPFSMGNSKKSAVSEKKGKKKPPAPIEEEEEESEDESEDDEEESDAEEEDVEDTAEEEEEEEEKPAPKKKTSTAAAKKTAAKTTAKKPSGNAAKNDDLDDFDLDDDL